MQKEKQEAEMKECSFKPRLIAKHTSPKRFATYSHLSPEKSMHRFRTSIDVVRTPNANSDLAEILTPLLHETAKQAMISELVMASPGDDDLVSDRSSESIPNELT